MKPFVYIFSTSLVICAMGSLGACSPKAGESGDTATAGESPAASLTAEEAAAYASYAPAVAADRSAGDRSASDRSASDRSVWASSESMQSQ